MWSLCCSDAALRVSSEVKSQVPAKSLSGGHNNDTFIVVNNQCGALHSKKVGTHIMFLESLDWREYLRKVDTRVVLKVVDDSP
jgi:hypothetical protein